MNRKQEKNMIGRTVAPFTVLMIPLVAVLCLFFFFHPASAKPTHLDKTKGQRGCSVCHKGHGERGTPLLYEAKDEICFECHSMAGRASDIYSEVTKPSRHPVLDSAVYHVTGEELPEQSSSQPRHAACFDCHNVHQSEKGKAIKGLRGYSGKGFKIKKIKNEYELCYNCHADSANLASDELNIALDFEQSNPSYHPIETYAKNTFVPSLKGSYRSNRLIQCTDCHGSDNPAGPQGPHGSIYEPILKKRYNRSSGPESLNSYDLCYACHDRASILGDESFRAHKAHIVYGSISCAQCHDPHGSRLYSSLITFDISTVYPNAAGEYTFLSGVAGQPRCLLSCHVYGQNYEHTYKADGSYCVNDKCPPGWQ